MTKTLALLNFQAILNYLWWKDENLICTTIDPKDKCIEFRMYFNPKEWPVEILQDEIESILDAEAKIDFSPSNYSENMRLTIDWCYI